MEERKDRNRVSAAFFYIFLCFGIWVTLIILKATGQLDIEWITVLIFCLLTPLFCIVGVYVILAICYPIAKLKRWHRRRKTDALIIRQAKAAGVWEKPQALGGRALELYAKRHGIKREPLETDRELRRRCMGEAEREYANWRYVRTDCLYGRALALFAWEQFGIKRNPGETDEELRARCKISKTVAAVQQENDQKQEGERING